MAELRTYIFIDSLQPQFASFLATVARGYALVTKEDGTLVRSVTQVQSGDAVDARLADGTLKLRVE